ncbi:sap30 [Anaeramoeba ignava]|uniref:Sap30 n=1 Tax=Anaeramoeba ignava TaxID=1746090 RepID=A0A9Q0REA7_ANAIG|nr:sap30 [Anaeramoeba ignava]
MGRDFQQKKKRRSSRKSNSKYSSTHKTVIDFSQLDVSTLNQLKQFYKIKADNKMSKKQMVEEITEKFCQEVVNEQDVISKFFEVISTNSTLK